MRDDSGFLAARGQHAVLDAVTAHGDRIDARCTSVVSGLVLVSSPEHDGGREGDGGEEDLRASVIACGDPSPGLEPAEDGLDPVATFVMLDGFAAGLPTGDTGPYPFVLQRISESVGVIAPVSQQPFRLRRAAQPGRSAGIVDDLAYGHEEADRAASASVTACGLAFMPPFVDRRLLALRRALRLVHGLTRANGAVPVRLHRVHRLWSVLGRPYAFGASRQRKPLRFMKTMPIRTGGSSTQGFPIRMKTVPRTVL